MTLKDVEAARRAHRRALRAGISERVARVAELLMDTTGASAPPVAEPLAPPVRPRTRLRLYEEDE